MHVTRAIPIIATMKIYQYGMLTAESHRRENCYCWLQQCQLWRSWSI